MKFLGIYPFKLYSHRQNDLTDCFSLLKTIVPYSEMTKGSEGLNRETLRQYSGACFNTLQWEVELPNSQLHLPTP